MIAANAELFNSNIMSNFPKSPHILKSMSTSYLKINLEGKTFACR